MLQSLGNMNCEESLKERDLFSLGKSGQRKDMITILQYVKVCHKEDSDQFVSPAIWERTR